MKPSFFKSTLSIMAVVSLASVIVMIFMGIEPNSELLSVITGVISAYLAVRNPQEIKE
jgi:predicted PurR-regulated permease PerM